MKNKIEKLTPYKPTKLQIYNQSWVGNGILLYSVTAEDSPDILGSVWVRLISNAFKQAICFIEDIYVPRNYRRCGVGTFMMKFLLENYGILQTGYGSKDGGMALMKSLGWKQNKQTGDWYLKGNIKCLK